ncbi:MAG: 5-(carboxyamino)imidazole ribonucleotide mutase [Planctomycetes bacterium]|nr:5-(carboxyamino)imidazole ribonucleotide mutase [Planctomycetota bacterium]HRV82999.1 5-(carboxyamino)imidazole ribonucleotide mutase [Planctomycetota bacterium]
MKVAILMGSDSDLDRLLPCIQTLADFGVPYEAHVMSAHRTPEDVAEFVRDAPSKGIAIFLCAAGSAAHLAGVVAGLTYLPVLGIPIDAPPLGGLDALLSTVQMPGGVPVATFAVGGGGPQNAALFAIRILALSDPVMARKVSQQRAAMVAKVRDKDRRLQERLDKGLA